MESFTITETLKVGKKQDIILIANNKRQHDSWVPIKKPADYASQGEAVQRQIIEEGRARGKQALEQANLSNNPLPSQSSGDVVLKRDAGFKNSLFNVAGKLTLGTEDSFVYIDGNKNEIQTALTSNGLVLDVTDELMMKNAVIMNSYNRHGYTAPIEVKENGRFTMLGGRISNNTSYEQIDKPSYRTMASDAVYVNPGGTFNMKAGLIDSNNGGLTGAVFSGSLGSNKRAAEVTIDAGIIANNKSTTSFQMGGGVTGFPKSKVTMNDGIIAGNKSGTGGGIAVSEQYIGSPNNTLGSESAHVNTNYESYLAKNKAEAFIDGGLIYDNSAGTSAGGVYVDGNQVNFGKVMILNNHAGQFGRGIYVSFPPIVQTLKGILVTDNRANATWSDALGGGNGGGLWNCPTGFVHIGDGHSVYVYNNESESHGKDITFSKKTWFFELNKVRLQSEFYSLISPVTKDGNFIKFIEDGKSGVSISERLSYTKYQTNLKAEYSDEVVKEAWKNSQTFVLGSNARNGGGIGSNANLDTPEDEGDYELEVEKNGTQVSILMIFLQRLK